MPSCREITELVTEYLEGSMSFGERVMFRMHLAMCPSCKRYIDQMELTVATLGELPSPVVPADIEPELMDAFRDWKRHSP